MRLIDGDELLTAFPIDDEPTVTKSCVRMTIQYMPTIEPMRKRGKWIDKSGGIEDAWNYCSVCGEQAIDLYDFCPNCGADMRKGGEDA
jgi:hypothetical protein